MLQEQLARGWEGGGGLVCSNNNKCSVQKKKYNENKRIKERRGKQIKFANDWMGKTNIKLKVNSADGIFFFSVLSICSSASPYTAEGFLRLLWRRVVPRARLLPRFTSRFEKCSLILQFTCADSGVSSSLLNIHVHVCRKIARVNFCRCF